MLKPNARVTIPEHQNMQVQPPHQMSNIQQVLHVNICLDHMSKHHQHPSKPVINKKLDSHVFFFQFGRSYESVTKQTVDNLYKVSIDLLKCNYFTY